MRLQLLIISRTPSHPGGECDEIRPRKWVVGCALLVHPFLHLSTWIDRGQTVGGGKPNRHDAREAATSSSTRGAARMAAFCAYGGGPTGPFGPA